MLHTTLLPERVQRDAQVSDQRSGSASENHSWPGGLGGGAREVPAGGGEVAGEEAFPMPDEKSTNYCFASEYWLPYLPGSKLSIR